MTNLTPLTDEDIEAESKSDKHRRSKKIDDAFTNIIVWFIYALAVIVIFGGIYFAYIYCSFLHDPSTTSLESIKLTAKFSPA